MKNLIIAITIFCYTICTHAVEMKSPQYSYGNNYHAVYDPYEKFNRKIFAFNSVLDYLFLRPVAVIYQKGTNNYIKARVDTFTNNIATPLTAVNYTLQGNVDNAMKSFWRFMINSTFGMFGLFDVASKIGLESKTQTFSSTLAHYGVGPGPYLVLPFFGGINVRDVTEPLMTNGLFNPLQYSLHKDFKSIFTSVKLIHDRANILEFTNFVSKHSADPYVTIRDAIYQRKESKVHYPESFEYPK